MIVDFQGVERLLNVRQVAEILGESVRTVQRRLTVPPDEMGSVPHVRLPGVAGNRDRVRFRAGIITRWIKAGFPPAAELRNVK
jgi:hypothetical protein